MKRLIKKSEDIPINILTNSPEEKVDPKDEATKTTYGPSINKEWTFEKPIDNPEWQLRDSFSKKQKR